jgi:hypothetical protein
MGTFAGTAIVDYHLSFANLGKQTSVFCFRLQQKQKFAVSICRWQETNGSCCFLLVRFSFTVTL